jgi:hypothetical protein
LLTAKPVKFGTILRELLAASAIDSYYKDPVERTLALSEALNKELNDLAAAGCPVIQMEEPRSAVLAAYDEKFLSHPTQPRHVPLREAIDIKCRARRTGEGRRRPPRPAWAHSGSKGDEPTVSGVTCFARHAYS